MRNCLASTDHRLKATRLQSAKVLPGKSLVILDPSSQLVLDVLLYEDGHAQERSLFDELVAKVEARQLWIADRNFCTRKMWFGIAQKEAFSVILHHKTMPYGSLGIALRIVYPYILPREDFIDGYLS